MNEKLKEADNLKLLLGTEKVSKHNITTISGYITRKSLH